MKHKSKAYDSGMDYYISGGRDITENPWPDGTTRALEWEEGYKDALQNEKEEQDYEFFSDIYH